MTPPRVLLVDDEVEFTSTLAARMRMRGLEVDVAESGIEALQRVEETVYDAIILDVAMPGMDGIETLKRLLGRDPDLQVMLLTGHATVQTGVEAMRSGAIELLEKPANLEEILAHVERARKSSDHVKEKRLVERIDDILERKGW